MSFKKEFKIVLVLFTSIICIFLNINNDANALSLNIEQDEQEIVIKETTRIFGNIEIENISYLYNLNDSPDYVYVDFKDLGYVIYYRDTFEIMEYSYSCNLEYSEGEIIKYYAGPSNYYVKKDNRFVDVKTGYCLDISESAMEAYASSLSTLFSKKVNERSNCLIRINREYDDNYVVMPRNNNSPEIDPQHLIPANAPGSPNTTYIDNYDYFLANPNHGTNTHGTCGSVAAQLLLGYNNYYNDRRLIDVDDLYGDWTGLVSSDLFDASNYLNPDQNMNVCNNPMSLTTYTTGTNDSFYNYVIHSIEPSAFNCVCTRTDIVISGGIATVTTTVLYPDGTNSITVTTRPANPGETDSHNTVHTHTGASVDDIVDGLESILSAKFNSNQYSITSDEKGWFFGWSPISSTPIKNEINAGRPLIIGMDSNLGGRNHFVIGYGYQDYTYPGDTETYSGYIVNYGWPNEYNIWINESWCDSYITLSINHVHDYSIVTSNIIGDSSIEVRCSTCGHRKLDDIFTISDNSIVGINYQLIGNIVIPAVIDGTIITSISNNVFQNCVDLVSITLPNTLTSIGNSSFKGCTSLEEINIPNSVNSIGNEAFYGCTSLSSVIVNRNKAPLLTLGYNVFYNHPSSFEITVPKNRLADYKNMSGWYSYRSSIEPSENISPINLYYNTGMNLSYYVFPGLNRLYAINVISQGAYLITITSSTNDIVKVYNDGFILKDTITSSKTLILYGSTVYYMSLEHTDVNTSGTISVSITKDLNHNHIYNHSYTWLNYNQHRAYCDCGNYNNEFHVVSAKSLGDELQYVTCILCGGPANAGIVPWDKGIQITNNGSFISPNGILILSDEDIESYLSGEIVFKYDDIEISRNINIPSCLLRKDEDYLL